MKCWQQSARRLRGCTLICFSLIREVHFSTMKHYSVRGVKDTAGICQEQMAAGALALPATKMSIEERG